MASIEHSCINVGDKQDVDYRYDIKLTSGEVNCNIELDHLLVRLSPTHNGISCAWRIKGIRKKIEIGTQIEVGHKILAKWNWKLYCTVIAVNVFSPESTYRLHGC